MVRMCKPIFGTWKTVVLYSGFCVAKFITELKAKGFYEGDLINKRCHLPKGVPGDLIDT